MAEATNKKKDEAEVVEAPPAPPKSKKKLFIIGGAVLLLLLVGAPVLFFTLRHGSSADEVAADAAQKDGAGALTKEGATDQDELNEGEEGIGGLFPLDTFVVNLAGGKFVRCQVQLEFTEREIPQRFYPRIVPVRDGIITMLANKTPDELSSQKGRDQLKTDIKELVNEMMRKEEVKRVYFTQFVIQ